MKIGLYSPYIPKHFGGGEKHLLTSAWYLSQQHEVEVLIPSRAPSQKEWRSKYEKLFGLDLSQVKFVASPLADKTSSAFQTWNLTRSYDAFLYLTDGSLFISGAKKNILHIQIPYTFSLSSPLEKIKLSFWKVKNANSKFTKKTVEKSWNTKIPYLHYPYVQVPEKIDLSLKTQDIIGVGRFIAPGHATHSKGQEILIEAFIQAQKNSEYKDSTLHLVGTIEPGAEKFVEELKNQAKNFAITFHHDISQQQLENLYKKASVFWHAAGWGIDEKTQPEKVEHFGMATIEAMAYGCIPLVLEKGGSKEIITRAKNGFFFEDLSELIAITRNLLRSKSKQRSLQIAAHTRAQDFSLKKFCHTLDKMLGET